MRKVIVISVVVAGLFLHEATHLSNASPEAGGISPPAQPAAAADRAKLPSSRACTVLMEYFRGQKADTPEKKKSTIAGTIRFANGQLPFELESGEKARACDLGGNQADVVIAMAPHPVNSVLALAFDREIESIQRAATSAGYEFHQHYFPWTAPVSGQGGGAKKESGENRDSDREPGLLLFREPPGKRPLVVLLLPETPSGYLDPSAFNASMAYARQLDPGSDTIRVLGPFFSGTVPLLRKLIDEWRENDKKHESIHFDFISGSATAKEILKNLQRPPYEQFHSMVNDDESALAAFKEYFQADGGLVLLSESGTAYGGQKFAIPGITFPREISRLRNANAQPGADSKAPLPALRLLPLDLRDSTPSQDIVRTFSGSQLPPSQEAVLLNIADQLRRERVRFVGILASDVHDEIFLAKFIATSCPNVRLFTLDPDLLFARAAEELPFAGLVTVGTYALLPRGVPLQGSNTVRHFPSQHAAGAYDAFRALLNRAGLCDARNGSLFQGHLRAADEFQIELKHDKERKVVSLNVKDACREGAQQWMVSVGLQRLPSEWTGLNGEWAAGLCDHLDIPFDSQKVVSDPPPQVTATIKVPPMWISVLSRHGYWPVASMPRPGFPPLEKPEVISGYEQPDGVWRFLFLAGSLLALMYTVAVLQQPSGVKAGVFYLPKYLAARLSPEEAPGQGRAWYVLIATLSLLFLYATLTLPLLLLQTNLDSTAAIAGRILFRVVVLVWALAALLLLWQLVRQRPDLKGAMFGGLCLVLLGWVLFRAANVLNEPDDQSHRFFAAYRTFDPLSGVSPAVPIALMATVVFCWAVVHAKRLWMVSHRAVKDLPRLKTNSDLKLLRKAIEDAIEQPFFNGLRLTGATITFLIAVTLYGHIFDSFESPAYAKLYAALAGIGGCVLFLTWWRFLLIWKRFSDFLEELARHPIRSALEKLPRTHSWSAIFQSPKLLEPEGWDDRAAETWNRVKAVAPVSAKRWDDPMSNCIEIISRDWNRGRSESWGRTRAEREKHLELNAIDRSDEHVIAAGEYVALPFHRFISYVLLHMRNLLNFISIAFALVTLSLFSFPFQSHHLLNVVTVVALVILGGSLAYVMALVEKNEVLSWINDTKPGELGGGFYVKILSYGAIPLLTFLSTQFPSVGHSLLEWIQPVSQALK